MNQIDFFARIIMETARHDPVIRDALYRLPRIPIPADHYHCSCCGRIILEKGTTKLARCARRWLGAIVGITKATWKSLSHAAIKVHQLFSQLKPGHIDRVKARAHNIWLTSSFSDEAASETTALITESNEPSGSRSMARRRRPDHSIQANSWRSTGKPSGLRSTIGELVKTVEPVKSEQSSKLAGLSEKPTAVEQCSEKSSNAVESSGKSNNASESSEKTANVAQVVQPAPPASAVSSKGQKCLEEGEERSCLARASSTQNTKDHADIARSYQHCRSQDIGASLTKCRVHKSDVLGKRRRHSHQTTRQSESPTSECRPHYPPQPFRPRSRTSEDRKRHRAGKNRSQSSKQGHTLPTLHLRPQEQEDAPFRYHRSSS
ncbi:uncharacterized protein RCC_03881 [Ramularia collo-cygni]|uniref:Uncharacterized protein n=1 Tax=Ramularia collo-cygni TaxID=112498 RepID=A0A2D3VC22_9PEZI|nr:uncharacterized protein RCC_03881 [Ramularia collo-cygni]CZT18043.1 uncharacterized protein RCC_03881 [Ramularia collo-cygni]